MAKAVVLGNGNILVGISHTGYVSDFFFPFVGIENHVRSPLHHKIGVSIDGQFSWLDNPVWKLDIDLRGTSLVTKVTAVHQSLGISLVFNDFVYNEKNIFVRNLKVTNHWDHSREVKVFFHQAFGLYGTSQEDTAYFDPTKNAIIHYEGRRVFMAYATSSDIPFTEYSVGLYGAEGKEGTWKDAEDGKLDKNSVEHGQVDSVLGITITVHKEEQKTINYWLTVGESKQEVFDNHEFILYKTPEHLLETTDEFWTAWVKRHGRTFAGISGKAFDLYNKSLLYVRTQIDNRGAIIASSDSDMLQHGRDTYSYMWPRDGAMTVLALLDAEEFSLSKRFFKFCNDVAEPDGYLMHKYRADRSLGSSWHPFIKGGVARLPIQEDETALVVAALYKYYKATKEIEFIEQQYTSFVKKAAHFMCDYMSPRLGLPEPSYDLWEEKHGISTFTSASVYLGLVSASQMATELGKDKDAAKYLATAETIKKNLVERLWNNNTKYFDKLVREEEGQVVHDSVVDVSSLYGIIMFGILNPHDEKVTEALKTLEERIYIKDGVTGVLRYEGDLYYSTEGKAHPWILCTLWYAQMLILRAKNVSELRKAYEWIEWTLARSGSAGILSEQVDRYTGFHLSATPLTWSHAEYIRTIHLYDKVYRHLHMYEKQQ